MLNLNQLLKSFGLFLLLFIVLLVLSSTDGFERRMGAWFIDSSTWLFETTMSDATINVEHDRNTAKYNPNEVWISPVGREWLAEAIQDARRTGQPLEIDNAASLLFKIGTFPKTSLVFLLSLVLATPMSWQKKAKSLAITLGIFAAYFFMFLYFDVLGHISNSRIGVYELEGFSASFVRFMRNTFCNFGFSLSFVVILWAVVCVDFNALFEQFNLALTGQSSKPKASISSKKKSKSKSKSKKNTKK